MSALNNIHADVLNIPIPTGESEKANLVAEIKRRGQNAFQRKSYLEAEALYGRAIDIAKDDQTLWSNRSAARIGMSKFDDALLDAKEAARLNPTWSKAHYRIAKAYEGLKQYVLACAAYEEVLKIEPNNTAAKSELEAIRSKGLDKVQPAQESDAVPATKKKAAVSTNSASSSAKAKSSDKMEIDGNEEDDDEPIVEEVPMDAAQQASAFKGYKKTADGKTTTYFHRDLTDEEKKLLQGNAPKPIQVEASVKKSVAGSAWNEKGTFEEKDCTSWAKNRLQTLMKEITFSFNAADGVDELSVTSVTEVDGDATISIVRGTKRWIFSFSLYLDWESEINFGDKDSKTVKGRIFLSDVGSDSLGKDGSTDYEIKWANRGDAGKYESKLLELLNKQMKQAVFAKLAAFRDEYLAMD